MPLPTPSPRPAAAPVAAGPQVASIAEAFGRKADLAKLRAAPPFLLVHHQGRAGSWEIVEVGLDEPAFVPVFQAIALTPGVHVKTLEPGEPYEAAVKPMLDSLARQGSMVLPESLGYMTMVDCIDPRSRTPGKHYHLVFERVSRSGLPDELDRIEIDQGAYNRWRLELATNGAVPPPSEAVLEAMQKRLTLRRSKLAEVKEENRATARSGAVRREELHDRAVRPWVPAPAPAPSVEAESEQDRQIAELRAQLQAAQAATAAEAVKAAKAAEGKAAKAAEAKAAEAKATPATPAKEG